MSFDLHEPVSSARAAAHPAAERAVDLAPSVDVGRTTRRMRTRAERRVGKLTGRSDRHPRALVLLLLIGLAVAGIGAAPPGSARSHPGRPRLTHRHPADGTIG